MTHRFGGAWTEEKLDILERYLVAYLTIMHRNPHARWFRTVYVDAFAGTGSRADAPLDEPGLPALFDHDTAEASEELREGSALRALRLDRPFDHYLFVEQKRTHFEALRAATEGTDRSVETRRGDANDVLQDWVARTDWGRTRAVVFLDPYGMSVDWTTIEALAGTRGVDLWLLFPSGIGIRRVLPTREPPEAWARRLTRMLGTEDWREAFYRPDPQVSLFDAPETRVRGDVTLERVVDFFQDRLRTVFPHVAKQPRPMRNAQGNPMFHLFFAAANLKGGKPAISIANHLLENW